MEEKVLETIRKYNLISQGDKILVGLSGGPDSLSLLHYLTHIYKDNEITVGAVLINHCIRGEEGNEDERFVREVCGRWNVPYYSYTVNVPAIAEGKSWTLEETGRFVRHKIYKEVSITHRYNKIALGHNLEDRCETVLMRIIRGTGPRGLVGMTLHRDKIIRPLLETKRQEIEEYCKRHKLNPRIDSTNRDIDYTRNKIRHILIPLLEDKFNPRIKESIVRLAENTKEEREVFEELLNPIIDKVLEKVKQNSIWIKIKEINKYSKKIQKAIIYEIISRQYWKGVERIHLEILADALIQPVSGNLYRIAENIWAEIIYDYMVINKKEKPHNTVTDYEIDLPVPGVITTPHGEKIITSIISTDHVNLADNDNPYTYYFDYDMINGGIFIRNRKNGDTFKPFGMKGSKKLKDFMSDEKIPQHQRGTIPLVIHRDSQKIMAVLGYRRSNLYPITSKTQKILKIAYKGKEAD